jgi:hypothetical protein
LIKAKKPASVDRRQHRANGVTSAAKAWPRMAATWVVMIASCIAKMSYRTNIPVIFVYFVSKLGKNDEGELFRRPTKHPVIEPVPERSGRQFAVKNLRTTDGAHTPSARRG